MKAGAIALAILLAVPGFSVHAETPARPGSSFHQIDDLPAPPQGPVLDLADILPPAQEAAMDQQLRDLNARSDAELIVVSLPSLAGETIENYANQLFNTWGIGGAKTRGGLLLLVAPNDRKVRIEVGCHLESTVSDDTAGRIIRETITPEYRKDDFAGGTQAGVDALIAQLAVPKPANDPGPHTAMCRSKLKEAA